MRAFFKLGEAGEFKYFSMAHFTPLILMFLVIYLLYKYQDQIRNFKYEKNIRLVMAFTLIIADMSYFWQKMYTGTTIRDHLPITICGWAAIFCAFMILSESKFLFDITYFWVIAGSSNALITPAVIVSTGPERFRFYQFWIEHTFIFIAVFYMIFIYKFRPTWKSFLRAFVALLILAIIAIYVNNNIEGANYLFLSTVIMASLVLILFFLSYLPYFIKDIKVKKATHLKSAA
ncbi:MAG: Integral rane protein [Haloplasmataceae bacterium]|nr:Integral rane protein [Haloplasmataceae bacterium]